MISREMVFMILGIYGAGVRCLEASGTSILKELHGVIDVIS